MVWSIPSAGYQIYATFGAVDHLKANSTLYCGVLKASWYSIYVLQWAEAVILYPNNNENNYAQFILLLLVFKCLSQVI